MPPSPLIHQQVRNTITRADVGIGPYHCMTKASQGILIHTIPAIIANPTKSRNYFSVFSVKKALQFEVYFLTFLCYTIAVKSRTGRTPGMAKTAEPNIKSIISQAFSLKKAIQGRISGEGLLICVVRFQFTTQAVILSERSESKDPGTSRS